MRSSLSAFDVILATGLALLFFTLAAPGYGRARLRTKAHQLRQELILIERATIRAALDAGIARGKAVPFDKVAGFLGGGDLPERLHSGLDPLGNAYPPLVADSPPEVSRASASRLRGAVPPTFWAPFSVAAAVDEEGAGERSSD